MTPTAHTENLPDRRRSGAFKWDLARPDEIPLWVADMDFPVAPAITEALHRRIEHPIFGYTSVPDGYPAAFVAWQRRRNGWEINPEHLVVVPSVMQGIAVAIEAYTQPGDTIAVFAPVYFPFYDVVEELGRQIRRIPLAINADGGTARYTFDFDQIEREASLVDAILLCSPHNPGGRVWSREELSRLASITARAGVPVISDEIHSDLLFPDERFVPWLTVSTGAATKRAGRGDVAFLAPSKTFNIPGLPIAWAVVPDDATRTTLKAALHARMHKLSNVLTTTAAHAAYTGAEGWLDEVRTTLRQRYETVRRTLADHAGVDVFQMEGTFIAWIDLRERWGVPRREQFSADDGRGDLASSVSRRFGVHLRNHGVWLSDGAQFGPEGDGFMRLNFATSRERLEAGLARVAAAIESFSPGQ